MRAYVYWNLHRDLYSVKNTRTGRIHEHAAFIIIKNATFAVSQAGRARVLRERRKNVHAGVRGQLYGSCGARWHRLMAASLRGWTRVTYNPYKYDSFVRAHDERPVIGADEVRMVIKDGRARVYARGLRYADQVEQAA